MSNYPCGYNHDEWWDESPEVEDAEIDCEPEPEDEPEPDPFPREEP